MLFVVCVVLVGLVFLILKQSADAKEPLGRAQEVTLGSVEFGGIVAPSQEDLEEMRKERQEARARFEEEAATVAQGYRTLESREEAVELIWGVLAEVATYNEYSLPKSREDLENSYAAIRDPLKRDVQIRKAHDEAYKKRQDREPYLLSLELAVLQVFVQADNPGLPWVNFKGLERLGIALCFPEVAERAAIFFKWFRTKLPANEKVQETISGLLTNLSRCQVRYKGADEKMKREFAEAQAKSTAADRHFAYIPVIEYYRKRAVLNPRFLTQVVEVGEADVKDIKAFLVHMNSLGRNRPLQSFEATLRSKDYFCPRLPAIDALVDAYTRSQNAEALKRVQSLASEIRYY